jgi:hypothetical protein
MKEGILKPHDKYEAKLLVKKEKYPNIKMRLFGALVALI